MSGRSGRQLQEYQVEGGGDRPGKCARFLKCTWKLCTCVFSHTLLISLVVTYCILGAFTFEKLEAANERTVKESIGYIRGNMTEEIWELTKASNVLHQENWTNAAIVKLKKFEKELMIAIKKNGWDGNNDMSTMQWTFAGALFYSIIVITTIGYGHIAPKTHWGKVVTIFYAILGIPLMLLCLSNIGDIMATSFRFLYWRVCCYVCTKRPRRKKSARRSRSGRGTIRGRYDRGRGTSFRKSGRTSTRSADSGFGLSEVIPSSYSDTECRYNGETGVGIQRILRPSQISRFSDSAAPSTSGGVAPVVPGGGRVLQNVVRGGSLDRRRRSDGGGHGVPLRTPVLCNRYAVDREVAAGGDLDNIQSADAERLNKPKLTQRSLSVPRQEFLEPPGGTFEAPTRKRDRRRGHHPPPSPRIMSPMGFAVQRQPTYVDEDDDDDDDYEDGYDVEYGGSGGSESRRNVVMKPVPIWLCVFLVVSYILAGAWLFNKWEGWDYLDSAYFCFITLTTIGFGDFVPAKRVTQDAEISIALCSLYLLFGIALLAMSFNLVQEEVIANVKSVAKRLGIIKDDEEHEEED